MATAAAILDQVCGLREKAATQPRKPKRQRRPALPLLGLLTGAGAAGTAYGLASDTHAADMQAAMTNAGKPLQPHETALTRYQDTMSTAARTTPFGVPVGELLAGVRSNAKLMGRLGMPSYVAGTPGAYNEARQHYEQFRKGPVTAYWHQMRLKSPGDTTSLKPFLTEGKQTYADVIAPKFEEAWRTYRGQKAGEPGHPLHGGGSTPVNELDIQSLPHDKQLEFMKFFHDSLTPELQALRQDVETKQWGPGLEGNKRNYLPVAKGLLTARETAKNVGITAGAAGLGGLAGHYLHRWLGRDDADADADAEASAPGHWLSTLGGMGLGGLAGYYGGTASGRGDVQSLLAKVLPASAS